MNILYLCDEYPPGRHGGIGTSVQLLARQMAKIGHTVVVAGLYSPGYGGHNEFDDEGVKVYRYRWTIDGNWCRNQQNFFVRVVNRVLKDTGIMDSVIKKSLASYKSKLEGIIWEYKIDIIEMPDYHDYVYHCRSYIPFPVLPVPVVVKMNGSIAYFNMEAGKPVLPHILKIEQDILSKAAAVAGVSKYTAKKSALYFSHPHKIEVLYNGINTDVPVSHVKKDRLQVIFTGTMVQKKGIYQLAKAWNIVIGQMPAARLVILGKGSRQKVVSLLNEQAKSTVTFMGHVKTGELYDHLAASALAVFPSYAEAFALAPLEAMACDTAVINSNRTSGPELVDDQINGLLIDPDNTRQIAEAILYLLNNPEVADNLAKKGNEKVKEVFEIGKVAEQNICYYQQVLNTILLNK
jgi:glycosyltransferase involved in cell wall biosynthesis